MSCEYVIFMAEGTLQMRLLMIWRWEDHPGLDNGITGVLTRGRQECQRRCDDGSRFQTEILKYYAAHFEDRGRDHKPRNVGSSRS